MNIQSINIRELEISPLNVRKITYDESLDETLKELKNNI